MTKTAEQVILKCLVFTDENSEAWAKSVVAALRDAGMLREPCCEPCEKAMALGFEPTRPRADRNGVARPVIDREELAVVLFKWDIEGGIHEGMTWIDLTEVQRNVWLDAADAVIAHLDADSVDDGTEWEKTYSYGCMKVEHDGFECLMNYGANVVAAEQCARSCGGKLMRRTAMFGEWEEIPNE